jgi:hypothetical protein
VLSGGNLVRLSNPGRLATTRHGAIALGFVAFLATGCGGAEAPDTAAAVNWEHTTSTDGNVTTVDNTAGSKWGGDARLVEELSIGQLEGADEYAFGMVSAIWPTDDRIYISDARLDLVRAYDAAGSYLFTIGATGQGPGEYESAVGVVGLPDGSIAVHDGQKLTIYDHDGAYVETWGTAENTGFRFMGPGMYAVAGNGDIYLRKMVMPEGGFGGLSGITFEMRQALPGALGESIELPSFDYEQPMHQITVGDSVAMMPIPFAAEVQTAMMPNGGFAAGLPTTYSFEIRKPDGRVVVAKRYWDPVPVSPGEVELQAMRNRVVMNGRTMDIDFSGADIPETKPAYEGLVATRDGRVVVRRSAEITVAEECLAPDLTRDDISAMDCTDGTAYADVFDGDGAFLGSFEIPEGAQLGWGAHIDGDAVWMSVQDDMGTVMVKRYRMMVPRDPADS